MTKSTFHSLHVGISAHKYKILNQLEMNKKCPASQVTQDSWWDLTHRVSLSPDILLGWFEKIAVIHLL